MRINYSEAATRGVTMPSVDRNVETIAIVEEEERKENSTPAPEVDVRIVEVVGLLSPKGCAASSS